MIIFLGCFIGAGTMKIRESYVAGKFYTNDSSKLTRGIEILLDEAVPARGAKPLGLILPHAGYAFSAQIAADGFKQASSFVYDTVIILGTNHTVYPSNKLYFYDGDAFKIPLGLLYIDKALQKQIMTEIAGAEFNNAAHEREHSIEVQLPFIKKILGDVKIIPIVVGSSDPEFASDVGKKLGRIIKDKNILVIASSDLTHYPAFEVSRKVDRETLRAVLTMDETVIAKAFKKGETETGVETSACGAGPVITLVSAMKEAGSGNSAVLSWTNSGGTVPGDEDKVVGYGSVMFSKGSGSADDSALENNLEGKSGNFTESDKDELLKLARRAIRDYLEGEVFTLPRTKNPALLAKQGAFVTLKSGGELRGCIGHMAEDAPLALTVTRMALAAAFDDNRFYPLQMSELKSIEIEISVLTPLQKVSGPEAIVIGRDGTVIEKGGRSAVFLPQVATEQGWTKEQMLENLCRKAGLQSDCYKNGCRFSTFRAIVFKEKK
jgi:MEMO1 family protein